RLPLTARERRIAAAAAAEFGRDQFADLAGLDAARLRSLVARDHDRRLVAPLPALRTDEEEDRPLGRLLLQLIDELQERLAPRGDLLRVPMERPDRLVRRDDRIEFIPGRRARRLLDLLAEFAQLFLQGRDARRQVLDGRLER